MNFQAGKEIKHMIESRTGKVRRTRQPHHKKKKEPTNKTLGITPRMKKMLDLIKQYIKSNGFSPSYEELKQLCGLRSKSGVHRMLHCLKERGYINFKYNMKRGIEVL